MFSVLVIGGGVSGSSVAARLHAYSRSAICIYVAEVREKLGPGLAYSCQDPRPAMAGKSGKLSFFGEAPREFVEWLLKHHGAADVVESVDDYFAPRTVYGDYLANTMEAYSAESRRGSQIRHVKCLITDLDLLDVGYVAQLGEVGQLQADCVVLATGNPRPLSLASQIDSAVLIDDPWDYVKIRKIPASARVLLVGSGQTMMDVVKVLADNRHRGQIIAASRRGFVAHAHSSNEVGYVMAPQDIPGTLREVIRHVRRAASAWEEEGGDWRAVMNSLRPHTQSIWVRLSLKEKQRFLRHLLPYWRIHRTRVPVELWSTVDEMRQSGGVRVIAGRIRRVEMGCNGLEVDITLRGQCACETIEVDRVVNCTGPCFDYSRSEQPLFMNLLQKGIIRVDPTGLGLDIDRSGRVMSKKGSVSMTMFAVGPPCVGALLEISVVKEIRELADSVAKQILHLAALRGLDRNGR